MTNSHDQYEKPDPLAQTRRDFRAYGRSWSAVDKYLPIPCLRDQLHCGSRSKDSIQWKCSLIFSRAGMMWSSDGIQNTMAESKRSESQWPRSGSRISSSTTSKLSTENNYTYVLLLISFLSLIAAIANLILVFLVTVTDRVNALLWKRGFWFWRIVQLKHRHNHSNNNRSAAFGTKTISPIEGNFPRDINQSIFVYPNQSWHRRN